MSKESKQEREIRLRQAIQGLKTRGAVVPISIRKAGPLDLRATGRRQDESKRSVKRSH